MMVSQEQINQWKSQYEEIFSVPILDQDFIFRVIGREEYKFILEEHEEPSSFQEAMCQLAVLYPEGIDFSIGAAGYAETLCNQIMEQSGLLDGQAKYIIDSNREEMMVYDYQADMIIREVFPEYPLEEIQSWSVKKFMYYLSRAEWTLKELRGVPLLTPEEQMMMMQEQMSGEMPPSADPQMMQQPQPTQEQPAKEGPLSRAEVEAMLSESTGQRISLNQETDLSKDRMPELAWFLHDEKLKGEED
jgi:hypothetical protein